MSIVEPVLIKVFYEHKSCVYIKKYLDSDVVCLFERNKIYNCHSLLMNLLAI